MSVKKVFAYLVSWTLFWIGDITSKIMELFDFLGHLYPIYNKLMGWSYSIQCWARNEAPWELYNYRTEAFRCQYWKNDV